MLYVRSSKLSSTFDPWLTLNLSVLFFREGLKRNFLNFRCSEVSKRFPLYSLSNLFSFDLGLRIEKFSVFRLFHLREAKSLNIFLPTHGEQYTWCRAKNSWYILTIISLAGTLFRWTMIRNGEIVTSPSIVISFDNYQSLPPLHYIGIGYFGSRQSPIFCSKMPRTTPGTT